MFNRRHFMRVASAVLPTGAAFGLTGCASGELAKAGIVATDYSRSTHWLSMPTAPYKPVDVFYLYPTAWNKVSTTDPNICEIDNPSMVAGAKFAFARQATAFEAAANIFAPYYRQADASYTLGLGVEDREKVIAAQPTVDALAAFDYFIQNKN